MLKLAVACSLGAMGVIASNDTTTVSATNANTNGTAATAAACTPQAASVNNSGVTCPAAAAETGGRAEVTSVVTQTLTAAGRNKVDTKAKSAQVANGMTISTLQVLKTRTATTFPTIARYCTGTDEDSTSTVTCMKLVGDATGTEPACMKPEWEETKLTFKESSTACSRRLEEEERELAAPTAFSVKTTFSVYGTKATLCGSATGACDAGFKKALDDEATPAGQALFATALKAQVVTHLTGTSTVSQSMGAILQSLMPSFQPTTAMNSATVAPYNGTGFATADQEDPTIAITYEDASTTSNAAAVTLGVMTLGAALLF